MIKVYSMRAEKCIVFMNRISCHCFVKRIRGASNVGKVNDRTVFASLDIYWRNKSWYG